MMSDHNNGSGYRQPSVYIIVLNWNGWQRTEACVRSLRQLRYGSARIVIVDNGSTDGSVARLRETCGAETIIANDDNLGYAGGNNLGIRMALDAGVDYVWILNNDTTVDPQALRALVEVAEADGTVGAVGSVLHPMSDRQTVETWGGGRVNLWSGRLKTPAGRTPDEWFHYLSGASLLLRSSAIRGVGLLDEQYFLYWEDTDLGFELRRAGWRLRVAADSHVFHQGSASLGKTNPRLDSYFNRSAVRFFRKHTPFPLAPILVGALSRLAARLIRGEWVRAGATVRGTIVGMVSERRGVWRATPDRSQ